METELPKDAEAAGVRESGQGEGLPSRVSSRLSAAAASQHKRVDPELCGKGSVSVGTWK